MTLTAPQPIDEQHEIGAFDFGVPLLDDGLKRRARANQASGASRTYVVCEEQLVVAYYAPASGAVDIKTLPVVSAATCLTPRRLRPWGGWRLRKTFKSAAWTRLDTRCGNPRPASRRSNWHSRNCRPCDFQGSQSLLSRGRFRGVAARTIDPYGDAGGYSGRDENA